MGGLAQYRGVIAAGKRHTFNVRGSFISLYSITGATAATIEHRQNEVGDKAGEAYTLELRKYEKWFVTGEYDAVTVINDGAESISVILLLGFGDFVREVTSRSDVPENFQVGTTEFAASANYSEEIEANNLRSRLIIMNTDTGAGNELRIQETGPAEGTFITLLEGEQYILNTKAAVWLRSVAPAGVSHQYYFVEEFFDA